MRSRGLVLFLSFIIFMGTGCVYTPRNIEESITRKARYKPEATHFAGQMAVCWEDRIYYVSDELGMDGIHSMKQDGSDVRFEFEAPKITRLIATDDAIYYVGVYEIWEKNHQLFGLFKKRYDSTEPEMLPMVYEYADSVCDAYIALDGTIAVLETAGITSSAGSQETLNFIGVERIVAVKDWDNYYFKKGESYSFNVYIGETGAYTYSGEITSYHNGENVQIEQSSVVDASTGVRVMRVPWMKSYKYIQLLHVDEDVLVFGEYDKLALLDRYTRDKLKEIAILDMEEDMWIDHVFKCSDGYIAIVKQEDRNNDGLYYINSNTEETHELMKLSDKVLIDVRDGKVLYAQGNYIRCQAVNAQGLGDMIYEIKMPGNVVRNGIFEIAGDWLFIHKHVNNVKWATNQLLYKVNLKTHEVVDVR